MSNFRKCIRNLNLLGGNSFVHYVDDVVSYDGKKDRSLVVDESINFKHDFPSLDDLSLESKIKAGVPLQEVDSVVFKSDGLSDSELKHIDDVITSSSDSDDDDSSIINS